MSMRALACAAVALSAAAAHAQTVTLTTTMTGAAERPTPVVTPATGTFTVQLNTVTGAWTGTGSFQGLTSTSTVAHIHGFANTEQTAPPLFDLLLTIGTSGTLSGSGTFTQAQIPQVLAGLTYVNVHSVNFPNGEIRGQLVPTPGAAALLAAGGLLALRRRRGVPAA